MEAKILQSEPVVEESDRGGTGRVSDIISQVQGDADASASPSSKGWTGEPSKRELDIPVEPDSEYDQVYDVEDAGIGLPQSKVIAGIKRELDFMASSEVGRCAPGS